MINEVLINYGVLGLWTLTLLYDKITFQKKILAVIEENTKALSKVNRRRR